MAKKHQIVITSPGILWDVRCSFHSLIALLVLALVGGAVYLTAQSGHLLADDHTSSTPSTESDDSSSSSKCNLFSGKWVYDNKSYPLYKEKQCTFMSDQLACEKFGRKDLTYQNWRWQPHHCDLPRFFLIFFSAVIIPLIYLNFPL